MTSVALILWPLLSLLFFLYMRVPNAVIATVLGGYLLLPGRGGFDLPLLPSVDKSFVASVSALLFAAIFSRRSAVVARPGWVPRSPVAIGLISLLIVGAAGTALTNADPIRIGSDFLPALRPYDAVSIIGNTVMGLIPFLLARKYLATPEQHRALLLALVISAFGYSFLALYEVRMSPQLNRMVYGYFPHSFVQHIRGGGWRPLVFLSHGLWLGIFFACATLAAFGLWRIGGKKRAAMFLAAGLWLFITLYLTKTLGAFAITILLLPLILLLPFRMLILAAATLAGTLVVYPVLRATDLVPTSRVVDLAARIDAERAASLSVRIRNEDTLLAKANERALFGWGGWGRNRVYSESGADTSITDGAWIISYSAGGWVRYVGEFGLLTFAILILAVRWRRYELEPATAVLSVVLAANLLDLIPNATRTDITWLLAGALAGRLELARASTPSPLGLTNRRVPQDQYPAASAGSPSGADVIEEAASIASAPRRRSIVLETKYTRFSSQWIKKG